MKLCFESGAKAPSHLEVLRFVTGQLRLTTAEVHSVYKDENDRLFFIKFLDDDKFNEFCNHVEEVYTFNYDDSSKTPVTLAMASRIFRYVRIFNLPPEIDDKVIALVLGQFGTIRQHVRERYPAEYNLNVFSGVRGVHMEIAKEIPANLFIGHCRARIYYDGLKNRCFYCKEEGHLKANCPKLATGLTSNGGGARSYSAVTAHGKPVSTLNTNVPPLVANMQPLTKRNDDRSDQTILNSGTQEAQPETSKQKVATVENLAENDESQDSMDVDPRQGQKRVATSSLSTNTQESSQTNADSVTETDTPLRTQSNKRNRKVAHEKLSRTRTASEGRGSGKKSSK